MLVFADGVSNGGITNSLGLVTSGHNDGTIGTCRAAVPTNNASSVTRFSSFVTSISNGVTGVFSGLGAGERFLDQVRTSNVLRL